MIVGKTKRPRNVDAPRAAAILYGDWGTSKAYVIGLAFAVAGYSSFWLILAMCVLMALVGVNYMAICRHFIRTEEEPAFAIDPRLSPWSVPSS
jgi:hypothetical protein